MNVVVIEPLNLFQNPSSTTKLHSSIQGLEGDQISLSLQIASMNVPLGGMYSCEATNEMGTTVIYSFLIYTLFEAETFVQGVLLSFNYYENLFYITNNVSPVTLPQFNAL